MPLCLSSNPVSRDFDVSRPWLNRVLEREPRRMLRAVDRVSFEVTKGETLALVGESGCGKSTVARLIVGLYAPTEGRIEFQRPAHADDLPGPLRQPQPALARAQDHRGADDVPETQKKPVGELLRQVGLSPDDAERYPHEFSGGQRQRISIARALAGEPDLLICDEPTSALDVSVQAQILNLMADLQERLGLTYLFISHNLAVVSLVADRVGVMYFGRAGRAGDRGRRCSRARAIPTRACCSTRCPTCDMSGKPRTPVAGEVPNPLAPPPGCAFHPRCPHANERCRVEAPKFLDGVACHAVEEGRI